MKKLDHQMRKNQEDNLGNVNSKQVKMDIINHRMGQDQSKQLRQKALKNI